MTTRSEKASRQIHLFVVSKQVCSELSEEEGLNHNSSCLHSDSNSMRGGQKRTGCKCSPERQEQTCWASCSNGHQRLLVYFYISAATMLFVCLPPKAIYMVNLITLTRASIISDRRQRFKLSQGAGFKLQIIFSFILDRNSKEHVSQPQSVAQSQFLNTRNDPFVKGQKISDLFVQGAIRQAV